MLGVVRSRDQRYWNKSCRWSKNHHHQFIEKYWTRIQNNNNNELSIRVRWRESSLHNSLTIYQRGTKVPLKHSSLPILILWLLLLLLLLLQNRNTLLITQTVKNCEKQQQNQRPSLYIQIARNNNKLHCIKIQYYYYYYYYYFF